jgi:hypothetical protein
MWMEFQDNSGPGGDLMNCEDEDYGDKPFTYCGKAKCESCGEDE